MPRSSSQITEAHFMLRIVVLISYLAEADCDIKPLI